MQCLPEILPKHGRYFRYSAAMRASRLLSILMLLQLRGRQTAESLAAEFEVSVRTIYRDVDELAAAGVPVISDRGPGGGFALTGGYRTQLTGLAADEAEAMLMIGLPEAAKALGIGHAAALAQRKLLTALPDVGREGAVRIGERFHLDPVDWYRDNEPLPQLPPVARAVLDGRMLTMRYESWSGERNWRVAPLGLVLKAGVWYLVAQGDSEAGGSKVRTFKVANILDFTVLDAAAARPPAFDLTAYWQQSVMHFEASLRPETATLRASREGRRRLAELGAFAAKAVATAEMPDAQGWATLTLPIESANHAARLLLGLAPEVVAVAPEALCAEIRALTAQMIALHPSPSANGGASDARGRAWRAKRGRAR